MISTKLLQDGFKILNKGGELFNYIKIKSGKVYLINITNVDVAIVEVGETNIEDGSHQIRTKLNDIQKGLKFFNEDTTDMEVIEDDTIKLISGRKSIAIDIDTNRLNVEYDISSSTEFKFDFKDFKKRFESVIPLKAKSETRPNIYGLHFNKNHMVTLDGYKMAVSIDNETDNTLDPVTIQGDTVKYLGSILKVIRNYDDLIIKYDDSRIEFKMDNVKLISNIYEGDYFNYEDIIRTEFNDTTKIKDVNVKELLDDIKFLEAMSDTGRIIDNKIQGYTRDENGNLLNEVDLNYDMQGDKLDISFNLTYMRILLNSLRMVNDTTNIGFSGGLNPIFFRNENSIYLLLPVRIDY